MVQRWLSGTTDESQIIFLNELVNPFVFSLHNHKELIYQLMTICTNGKPSRYNYPKQKSSRKSNLATVIQAVSTFLGYSTRKAYDVLPLLTDDDILYYAGEIGMQSDEISKIKRELKTR